MRNADIADGSGEIISVNSWGYGNNPGMGSPIIDPLAGRCMIEYARAADFDELEGKPVTEQGAFINCFERGCVNPSTRRLRANCKESK